MTHPEADTSGGRHIRRQTPPLGVSRRSEPSGQRVRETGVREVSHPGHVSVGSDQHRWGGNDLAEDGEIPHAVVPGVDQLDPLRPGRDVESARLTQVEQHRPSVVQQGEHA